MSKSQKKMLEKLKSLKGEALSAEYRKQQVAAHRKAVDRFSAYVKKGDDETLKAWAGKTLTALQDHLKMAQGLGR